MIKRRLSMTRTRSQPSRSGRRGRSSILLLLGLLLLWCVCLGAGLAQAINVPQHLQSAMVANSVEAGVNGPSTAIAEVPKKADSGEGTVDVIPERYQAGQAVYLKTCATCHIGIPPAVLPTETWKDLLQDSQHYGATLQPLVDPNRFLVWNYLKIFSRPRSSTEERTPYRVADSHYFRALHPKVTLPRKFTLASCATCHPGSDRFNFRQLTAEAAKSK
jgi:Dihaem cytochrome c